MKCEVRDQISHCDWMWLLWLILFEQINCNTFSSPSTDEVVSPTDLQFFEVSDKKIVLTWTGPTTDVSGYRVTVVPVDENGTPQREMTLPVSQNSYTEVTHLQPGTQYRFNIYTINNGEESLPLTGEQTTSKFTLKGLFLTSLPLWKA